MNNQILIAISNTATILMGLILIGLFIHFLQFLLVKLFVNAFGSKFSNIFFNKITFIGVMHHELSHALFAFITGAKVVKISLFKPNKENCSLGHVLYATRGMFIFRCIQDFFAAIAPVVCGCISIFCMIYFIPFNAVWQYIVFGFIILCIFIHIDLSTADLKAMLKGIPILIVILFCIFYFTKFNFIEYIISLFR